MEAEEKQALIDKIEALPAEKQEQVVAFVEELTSPSGSGDEISEPFQSEKSSGFSWRGALSDYADEYTSVELQHEILRDREEEESTSSRGDQEFLRQDWAGELRHLKNDHTSLELEDEALRLWKKTALDD